MRAVFSSFSATVNNSNKRTVTAALQAEQAKKQTEQYEKMKQSLSDKQKRKTAAGVGGAPS